MENESFSVRSLNFTGVYFRSLYYIDLFLFILTHDTICFYFLILRYCQFYSKNDFSKYQRKLKTILCLFWRAIVEVFFSRKLHTLTSSCNISILLTLIVVASIILQHTQANENTRNTFLMFCWSPKLFTCKLVTVIKILKIYHKTPYYISVCENINSTKIIAGQEFFP